MTPSDGSPGTLTHAYNAAASLAAALALVQGARANLAALSAHTSAWTPLYAWSATVEEHLSVGEGVARNTLFRLTQMLAAETAAPSPAQVQGSPALNWLEQMVRAGYNFEIHGNAVMMLGSNNNVTPEMRAKLIEYKDEIVAHFQALQLQQQEQAGKPPAPALQLPPPVPNAPKSAPTPAAPAPAVLAGTIAGAMTAATLKGHQLNEFVENQPGFWIAGCEHCMEYVICTQTTAEGYPLTTTCGEGHCGKVPSWDTRIGYYLDEHMRSMGHTPDPEPWDILKDENGMFHAMQFCTACGAEARYYMGTQAASGQEAFAQPCPGVSAVPGLEGALKTLAAPPPAAPDLTRTLAIPADTLARCEKLAEEQKHSLSAWEAGEHGFAHAICIWCHRHFWVTGQGMPVGNGFTEPCTGKAL